MTHYWFWKKKLPERNGQFCKILARGRMNSVLVEFKDGCRVLTSRYDVRRTTSRKLAVGRLAGNGLHQFRANGDADNQPLT